MDNKDALSILHDEKLAQIVDNASGGPSKRLWIASLSFIALVLIILVLVIGGLSWRLNDCTQPAGKCYQDKVGKLNAEADARNAQILKQVQLATDTLAILQSYSTPEAKQAQAKIITDILQQINSDRAKGNQDLLNAVAKLLNKPAPILPTTPTTIPPHP